jgi:hypothetical protein
LVYVEAEIQTSTPVTTSPTAHTATAGQYGHR